MTFKMHPISIVSRCVVAGFLFAAAAASASAEVVVGPVRKVDIPMTAARTLDDIRNSYRRPKTIPFPAENPYTVQKASLGKKLYFDSRLSGGQLLSCSSCHTPAYGWADGQPTGVGHLMKRLGRRSPTIVNLAYSHVFMWDGRADTLEAQALGPIVSDTEMALPIDKLMARLKSIEEYPPLFEAAFPGEGLTPNAVGKAIATYERTVVSGRAPFDAWLDGDDNAISASAQRGFAVFNGKGQCNTCHSGWNFTDDSFHDIGLASDDIGRGKFLPDVIKAKFAFKTPGLREITLRQPYMHDGSIPTLEGVVDHYMSGGIDRDSRSDLIKPVELTDPEKADLVAFLKTLTSSMEPTTVPVLPR